MGYLVKTPNYKFKLRVDDIYSPIHIRRFTIGDEKGLCLEASLFMPDVDKRFAHDIHVCNISQLDALESCLLEKHDSDAKIGQEILYAFINILKANYNHITHITLRDSSYIPCNRFAGDTLDLLSYNIAIYGKTWYEMILGAYIKDSREYARYKEGIAAYTSILAKQSKSWESFYADIVKTNIYACEKISMNESLFKRIFEESRTWPECIEAMKNHVSKEEKCKFFKSWLERLIYLYVPEKRDWMIDITINDRLKNVLNISQVRPMRPRNATRKHRTSMKS